MDTTRLESLFPPVFRRTESADTRLGIKRDEQREQGSKNKDREKDKDDDALWQDRTTVSVPALEAFLTGLLETPAPVAAPQQAAAESAAPAPATPPPRAAAAARAYQSTARGGAPQTPPPQPAGTPAAKLSEEERQMIRRLLDDLSYLAARKIDYLEILRGDSFLQSLVDAAARARRGL